MPHPERFFGTYEHLLDDKGRLILPAKLRDRLEGPLYMTRHRGSCLALWKQGEFDKEVELQLAEDAKDEPEQNAFREWAAAVHEAEMDKQGRMPIPPPLRSYAGLESTVIVNGAVTRIEFWSPARWADKQLPSASAGRSSTSAPSSQPPVSSI